MDSKLGLNLGDMGRTRRAMAFWSRESIASCFMGEPLFALSALVISASTDYGTHGEMRFLKWIFEGELTRIVVVRKASFDFIACLSSSRSLTRASTCDVPCRNVLLASGTSLY
jgi:hypothetical protein